MPDFDLINLILIILGLHIDNTQFVVEKLPVIVGIEYINRGNRGAQLARQDGIEEMDQKIAVLFRSQQRLEDAVYFWVYPVFHGGIVANPLGKTVNPAK